MAVLFCRLNCTSSLVVDRPRMRKCTKERSHHLASLTYIRRLFFEPTKAKNLWTGPQDSSIPVMSKSKKYQYILAFSYLFEQHPSFVLNTDHV